ncbi:UDP-N-acetylmuramoyl-tripeptide--D-alanyl-D-alanine ligase [Massilia oculi]|uniref:UDP-N-acetylmuramoyl-tripeptide--D-alanyl-D-alanine ligase n=1 Tax=Massilia oculi TaxID=945844 RepID=A0A2S2DGS8_9BURK|nr:UDP-N-acetylmuramoyl-tripeptide--D-alanyl-D-alanine ligase [Massilia oculi]AWL04555.1 UDP-N-acetylmuramoyl-tripeptide--D-alanyl-D-alanine ligase [Massilia oculi]
MRGSLQQLVEAIPGARLVGTDASFEGISLDSRKVEAGALFVALVGETFDAHDFLDQVVARNVAAVVVSRLPEGWTLPAIIVPDTLVALGRIAHAWRAQFQIPVIGVTGSNGKTTVKEMIAAILAAAVGEDARLATQGNLNNEIGVPLTLFRLDASHRAAVVELGMNHPGEIGRLSAIATPTVGLVNNAQREHQEFMHTVEAVARENGAVLQALSNDGVAVFPGDDTYTDLWRGLAACEVITFGLSDACDVRASYTSNGFGSDLQVTARGAQFSIKLAAAGEHNVRNALAAIACALGAGIDQAAIVRGLESFAPVGGRLQRKTAANGATVIDDTYNANPDSMRAAIDVLAACPAPRILVVGDMGEVGAQGKEFHEEIGAYAATRGIETVLATGELARHLVVSGARHYEQFDELLAALDEKLGGNTNSTVLVKGSRFMKMERVVQHLTGSTTIGKGAH